MNQFDGINTEVIKIVDVYDCKGKEVIKISHTGEQSGFGTVQDIHTGEQFNTYGWFNLPTLFKIQMTVTTKFNQIIE